VWPCGERMSEGGLQTMKRREGMLDVKQWGEFHCIAPSSINNGKKTDGELRRGGGELVSVPPKDFGSMRYKVCLSVSMPGHENFSGSLGGKEDSRVSQEYQSKFIA